MRLVCKYVCVHISSHVLTSINKRFKKKKKSADNSCLGYPGNNPDRGLNLVGYKRVTQGGREGVGGWVECIASGCTRQMFHVHLWNASEIKSHKGPTAQLSSLLNTVLRPNVAISIVCSHPAVDTMRDPAHRASYQFSQCAPPNIRHASTRSQFMTWIGSQLSSPAIYLSPTGSSDQFGHCGVCKNYLRNTYYCFSSVSRQRYLPSPTHLKMWFYSKITYTQPQGQSVHTHNVL